MFTSLGMRTTMEMSIPLVSGTWRRKILETRQREDSGMKSPCEFELFTTRVELDLALVLPFLSGLPVAFFLLSIDWLPCQPCCPDCQMQSSRNMAQKGGDMIGLQSRQIFL